MLPGIGYALLIAGPPTGGLTCAVAAILAYVSRKDAPEWLASHYEFQIRTFWLAVLFAVISGLLTVIGVGVVLMVAVGFSAGVNTGYWAIFTYFLVQNFDGYVVIPMVAKRTVDMPPALTLSSQILASTLFGVFGLALADPMVAMIKVALVRESELAEREDEADRAEAAHAQAA